MVLKDTITNFDGNLILKRFAYEFFGAKTLAIGNIISFNCDVEFEEVVGKNYLNFCFEIPNIDRFGGVIFHKLFLTKIANLISKRTNEKIFLDDFQTVISIERKVKRDEKEIITSLKDYEYETISYSKLNYLNGVILGYISINFQDVNNLLKEIDNEFYRIMDNIFIESCKL